LLQGPHPAGGGAAADPRADPQSGARDHGPRSSGSKRRSFGLIKVTKSAAIFRMPGPESATKKN